jgi:hypothetical protein
MSDILPQTRTNDFESLIPIVDKNFLITIAVGEPVQVQDLLQDFHRKARRRAVERNNHRLNEYKKELARAGISNKERIELVKEFEMQQTKWAAASAAEDAFLNATSGNKHVETPSFFNKWFGFMSTSKPTPIPIRPTPGVSVSQNLIPINTIDEASDHTGASAHVAGIAKPLSSVSFSESSSKKAFDWPTLRKFEQAVASATAGITSEIESNAAALAREVATEVEASAAELVRRVRSLTTQKDVANNQASQSSLESGQENKQNISYFSGPISDKARAMLATARSKFEEAKKLAQEKWSKSISVPKPVSKSDPHSVSELSTTVAPLVSGPQKQLSITPKLGFSEDPAFEYIPTRTLRTGTVVPAFVEAPLLAKPPDHDWLSPEEAIEEENYRLQLYSDLAMRLENALVKLEAIVMERRRAANHVESRPMEGILPEHRFGPANAKNKALKGIPRLDEVKSTNSVTQ